LVEVVLILGLLDLTFLDIVLVSKLVVSAHFLKVHHGLDSLLRDRLAELSLVSDSSLDSDNGIALLCLQNFNILHGVCSG